MTLLSTILLACGMVAELPPPAAVNAGTNVVSMAVSATNAIGRSKDACAQTQPIPAPKLPESVFRVYKDSSADAFDVEAWAESLTAREQGVYVKNGTVLVLVRDACGEDTAFRKTKCQFAAYQILRKHYPDLPARVSLSNRLLVNDTDAETGNVFIVAFREQEILALYKSGMDTVQQ